MTDDLAGVYLIGTVKWFNNAKAFGFIELPGGGLDVFVHANQLRKSGIDRVLEQGELVRFQTSKGPKGSFAVDISILPPLPKQETPNGG
jgi:cold shock protein